MTLPPAWSALARPVRRADLRGTGPALARAVLDACAHAAGGPDPRLDAALDVLVARFARDTGRFSEVLEPSFSWDRDGWHAMRLSYAFPGWREDPADAVRWLVAMASPFGEAPARFARRLVAPLAEEAAVAQPLYGLAWDAPDRWRVKVYVQFEDGAGPAAPRLAGRLAGLPGLEAACAGRHLHLLGVDLGPGGIAGVKLYVLEREATGALASVPLVAHLAAAGHAVRDLLAIHRIARPGDPPGPPVEVDFALPDNGLDWADVASEPAVRRLGEGADVVASIAGAFRLAVRRVSVPVGPLDKLNVYHVPVEARETP